jgi:hypothetical protein
MRNKNDSFIRYYRFDFIAFRKSFLFRKNQVSPKIMTLTWIFSNQGSCTFPGQFVMDVDCPRTNVYLTWTNKIAKWVPKGKICHQKKSLECVKMGLNEKSSYRMSSQVKYMTLPWLAEQFYPWFFNQTVAITSPVSVRLTFLMVTNTLTKNWQWHIRLMFK